MSKAPFLPFEVNLETFIDDLQRTLDEGRSQIAALLAIEEKSYANFVKPFEMLDERLEHFFTPMSHLHSVNNSDKTQEVYTAALPLLTEYGTEIGQNLEIYTAFKAIKANAYDLLSPEQQRVIDLNIQGFELSGAHLDEASKKRLAEISLRRSELSNTFTQNLLDATNAFEYVITDPADVEGMPKSDIESAAFETEAGETAWKFTLQMPSYIAYMTYGPNREIREALYKGYTTRAPENAEIIEETLALRKEASRLIGFETYAERSLATKMAKDPDTVLAFLNELADASMAQGQRELAELREFAGAAELQSYDSAFYGEQLKKNRYDIDEEEYRPYFEQNSVVEGLFEFLHRLFGVSIRPAEGVALWHETATAHDLYVDGQLRARLYLDLEARSSKRGGAWMHNWQSHCLDEEGNEQLASAFIVCNFPPSSASTPSLLRHDDVVTLFHETGHAIHHLLSTVNENGVSGVNGVEWDAVEFPSQFLENFAYEPQVLKLFAKHHESGDVISDLMIDKLVRAKNFQSAMSMLRQLEFAIFDFTLHMEETPDVQAVLDAVRERTALLTPPSYNKFQNGFSHIFAGGYAAGYYSYKWAEVLSADAFFAIVDQGVFDTALGRSYLDIVLGRGGSESMRVLFYKLMEREPETQSLLRLSGIEA
ncbi:M3 family metallopeptidase [Sulfurimonas sp. HSL-3221]|uniref:M3 family metallopeptidase n=1 Tax=Sulfurimonadaceae TaxID=2771471 RepID=UPI001E3F162F|nr:M3 family metallopeptidase [Sulfurimonas sp. HSL-3221]UFS63557.1 M3 family metallopeptidase [Sulfurimonas sp. HSL-3221]